MMKEPVVVASKFRSFSSITDPNGVRELTECSATVLIVNSQIFSTFSVVLLMLGHPECLSSSSDSQQALKCECNSKTAVLLKEHFPKASRSISRVLVADIPRFTQNLMQTHCSILPSIADKT
jgi:hypothetical protein